MDAVRKLNDDSIRRREIWTDDGVRLSLRYYGDDRAPVVVLAHGFGQTQHAWKETARRLAASGWQAVTYDARGHGESDRGPGSRYAFDHFIEDFRRVCDSIGYPPVVIGASMGGLVALLAHMERPRVDLKALVLVDIAPRWDQQGVSAMLDFMRQNPEGFATLEEARERIRSFLPHRRHGGSGKGLQNNLREGADGRWYWHWDPALLALAERGHDLQGRLKSAARRLKTPTMLVSGEISEMIGQEHVDEFLKLAPHAEHQQVADAGHMTAGDVNDRFFLAIRPFLNRLTE